MRKTAGNGFGGGMLLCRMHCYPCHRKFCVSVALRTSSVFGRFLPRKRMLLDGRMASSLGSQIGDLLLRVPRQVSIVHFTRAVNTLRCIHVIVPRDAELEVGFYRWLMHVSRLARQLDCRIMFYCTPTAWETIREFCGQHYKTIRMSYVRFDRFSDFPTLAATVHNDHLLVLVCAREGSFSWQPEFQKIPAIITRSFAHCSVMLIFPDQYGIEHPKSAFSTGFRPN